MTDWYPPLLGELRVTSQFGTRTHPITGEVHSHSGTDLGAPEGTPIYPMAVGYVDKFYDDPINGHGVRLQHAAHEGEPLRWTSYIHMREAPPLVVGEAVFPLRTIIGYVGSTGRSTGPHLHLELREGVSLARSSRVDPLSVLG